MEHTYGNQGLRIDHLTALGDAIVEMNGADQDTLCAGDFFKYALKAERHLYSCGIVDIAKGAVAVITTAGEPVGGKAVVGNRIVMRRAAHEWRLMQLGHVICQPGDQGSFDVILTDRQHAVIRAAQEYVAAA